MDPTEKAERDQKAERDGQDGQGPPGRTPLLDPRLAGAGGMLVAGAAVAWLLTQGSAPHAPALNTPTPRPPGRTASAHLGAGATRTRLSVPGDSFEP